MTAARFKQDLGLLAAELFEAGKIDRREFLVAMGIGGAAAAVMGSSEVAAQTKEIVMVNFGGDAVAAWQKAWGDPFTADSGIKVAVTGGEPTVGAIKAQVESGKVVWDTADGDAFYIPILAKQNLIEPYDYTKVDKSKIRPEFIWEHGCASYLYSTCNGYNLDKTNNQVPNGYKEFLDFDKFPGKRALYKWLVGSLEAVLIGAGVEPSELYPLDVDKAFGLLTDHKDQFVMWGGGAASMQLFRDGEVVMGPIWSTRASVLDRETKGRMSWTWDHGIVAPGPQMVLKGNPAGGAVFDLLASMQKPERQIELLKLLGNGPANPAASAMLPPELQKIDPGYEPNYKRQIQINTDWYAENYDRVQGDFLDVMAS